MTDKEIKEALGIDPIDPNTGRKHRTVKIITMSFDPGDTRNIDGWHVAALVAVTRDQLNHVYEVTVLLESD